jgi:hypothetical protein
LAAAILAIAVIVIGSVFLGLGRLGQSDAPVGPGPGEITRYTFDGPPQPLVVGEGAAWVKIGAGDGSPNYLARIDAQTGEISKLDTPGGDWSAVGGGSAWLLCDAAACDGGSVLRLDPSTGEQVGSTRLPGRGIQIAGVEDGVWVSTDAGLVFIDRSGEIVHQIGIRDADLIGSDGQHLWVSTSGRVLQLDPQSGDGLSSVPFSDPCTMEVADGMVWVASCGGTLTSIGDATDELMGIDASTGDVMFQRAIEGYGQMRYANGVLWLAQRDPSDQEGFRILRFDPRTGEDLGSPIQIQAGAERFSILSFPPSPFLAVGEGSLWLTDFGAGEVIRIGMPSDLSSAPGTTDPGTVPDLVGLQISDAIQAAEEAGLTVGTIQELDASKLGEPGADNVVTQDPAPGVTVDAGGEISVSVTAFVHSGPSDPDQAIDSTDSLLVVFSEGRKGVFVVAGNGDVREQVVRGDVDDVALSPGGDQVAYVNGTGIWLQAVGGAAPVQLTTDSSDGSPTWSPDGVSIAFSRERSSGSGIYVVASNGESEPRRLTEDSVVAFTPAWSPDGQQIAFVGYPSPVGGAAPDPSHLYVMTSNGSNVRALPGDDAAQPAWSPTGDRLAFVNSWSSIAVIDVDGSDMHEIYNAAPGPALSPVWAPDGQRLAFVAGRTIEDLRVFAIAQDGTALTSVTGEGLAALDVVWAK